MSYINRRWSHERRVVHLGGVPTLTFHQNFLLNSGSTMAMAAVLGPTLTFERASGAGDFDSSGVWAYAPHQLLENANLSSQAGDPLLPSGWTSGVSGGATYTDRGDFFSCVQTASGNRPKIANATTLEAGAFYTAGMYVHSHATSTQAMFVANAINLGGGEEDGKILAATFDGEGWYACAFKMGATDVTGIMSFGLGNSSNDTGTMEFSRPFVLKGLIAGVTTGTTGFKLSGEPLGRWIGTDDGDEPRYDQPVFAHDPADSNAQLGLGIWEARTQIGKQTSNLTGDQWAAINSDVPTENNTDIFGGTTADELAATFTADQQVARHQSYTGLTANVDTAVAAYVKTGTNATFVQLAWDSDGSGADGVFCNFQLTGAGTKGTVTAMTAGTATRAHIKLTTQGFYRCSVVGKIATGTVGRFTVNIVDRIDAVKFEAADLADNDSLIVNAIDVQVGAIITPHIPNAGGVGTSVTRATELPGTTNVSWFNAPEGTWIVGAVRDEINVGTAAALKIESEAQANDAPLMQFQTGGSNAKWVLQPRTIAEGFLGEAANTDGSEVAGVAGKYAAAYATNDLAVVGLGGTVENAAITYTTKETGHDEFHLGHGDGVSHFNGYLRFVKHHIVRTPNAFIKSETA